MAKKDNLILKTNRLLLQEIVADDLDLIHKLHSVPEVDEYNTLGIPEGKDVTLKIIKPVIDDQKKMMRSKYWWKIIETESDKFIGLAGMTNSNDCFRIGEIFYKIHPDYWSRGYATEVAKALVCFGFNELKLHKIEAGVATENTRSIRVLEKTGMTREGIRRKILPIRGEWKDNYHYAILEDDPRDY